ncbi:hypothetical protein SAMN05192543_105165 [Paraburkholderia megapolitana]|uniref:Uncharacterized protein n=1 Tax=Paraburkholderia megapolitana TaxID=420953 RepID=A0A1I3MYU3_9BURK|nr:hypothetical protein SAMN05192543_105165 [Paraburkholderia megapolitana]
MAGPLMLALSGGRCKGVRGGWRVWGRPIGLWRMEDANVAGESGEAAYAGLLEEYCGVIACAVQGLNDHCLSFASA